MKLYLVRHGQTPWNLVHRCQGHSNVPLHDYGRKLARITGEGLKDIPFDFCLTSPLDRARETAELILEGRDIPIIDEEGLLEISFGDYEGVYWTDENWCAHVPREFKNFFDAPDKYPTPPNGESFEALLERTGKFISDLITKKEYEDKTILLSTHGACLKAILNNIEPLSVRDFWKGELSRNCAVTEIHVEDGIARIVSSNKVYYDESSC